MRCWPGARPTAERKRGRGRGRLPGVRHLELRERHQARDLGRRPLPCVEPDGSLRLAPDGKPLDRTMLIPKASVTVNGRLARGRPQGHRQRHTMRPMTCSCPTTTRSPASPPPTGAKPARSTASPPIHLYGIGFAAIALGLARASLDAFVALAATRCPRPRPSVAARQCRDPVAGGAGARPSSRIARAVCCRCCARAVDDRCARRGALRWSNAPRSGSPASTRRTRPRTWSTPSITPPAPPRSSRAIRSSAASATCTP